MKPHFYLPMVALCAMLSFSCSTDELPVDDFESLTLPHPPATKEIEIEILELINAYRIENGFNALEANNIIKSVAFTHTDYMVETDDVSHQNFHLRRNSLKQYANAKTVSENVGYAYSSAQSVVNAWIASDAHRETIVGDYTNFDISAEKNDEGRWFYTNIFIKK